VSKALALRPGTAKPCFWPIGIQCLHPAEWSLCCSFGVSNVSRSDFFDFGRVLDGFGSFWGSNSRGIRGRRIYLLL